MPCHPSGFQKNAIRAFTLVELLVVIAIIGVLIALLLPAVQAARESARQSQCSNNIKQLALGCISHETHHGHFPHGGWGYKCVGLPDKGFGPEQPGGWIYNVLPYIEQEPLRKLSGNGSLQAQLRELVETPLKTINCPSRRPTKTYPVGADIIQPYWSEKPRFVAKTDYAMTLGHSHIDDPGPSGMTTLPGVRVMEGMVGRAFVVRAALVRDGLSNTYLLGEKYVWADWYTTTGDDNGDNENAYIGSDRDTMRLSLQPSQDRAGYDNTYAFGSAHAGVFIMAMADGSVRKINYSIDPQTHWRLVDRRDGQVIDFSKL